MLLFDKSTASQFNQYNVVSFTFDFIITLQKLSNHYKNCNIIRIIKAQSSIIIKMTGVSLKREINSINKIYGDMRSLW